MHQSPTRPNVWVRADLGLDPKNGWGHWRRVFSCPVTGKRKIKEIRGLVRFSYTRRHTHSTHVHTHTRKEKSLRSEYWRINVPQNHSFLTTYTRGVWVEIRWDPQIEEVVTILQGPLESKRRGAVGPEVDFELDVHSEVDGTCPVTSLHSKTLVSPQQNRSHLPHVSSLPFLSSPDWSLPQLTLARSVWSKHSETNRGKNVCLHSYVEAVGNRTLRPG